MTLKDRIQSDMKAAMKAGERDRLKVVRLMLAAIKQVEIDQRIELEDAAVTDILGKMVKQRRDSVEQFQKGGRDDLAAIEQAEIEEIETYLPEPLDEAEIERLIDEAIASTGAQGIRDMGKVMGIVKGKAAGRAGAGTITGGNAPMGLYPCKPEGPNDYVYLYVTRANNSHWHRLLKVIGREELIEDERFDSPRKRFEHKKEIDDMVARWTRSRTKQEAMEAIGSSGIPCGAVYDTMEIINEPHFEKRGIFQHIDHPQRGDFKMAAWPVKMSGMNVPVKPAPLLGADNENVLTEWLGLSSDDVKTMKDKGTLG